MLKLAVAVFAVALAGSASAAGWRSLRVDGKQRNGLCGIGGRVQRNCALTSLRVRAGAAGHLAEGPCGRSSRDTRIHGQRLLGTGGLGYKQVVTLLDPTGDTEQLRRKEAYARLPNRYAGNAPNTRAYTPPV